MQAIPSTVHKGMKVYDSAMKHIGTVESFKGSDEDPATPDTEINGVSDVERPAAASILSNLFDVGDALPRQLQEKLLREGFVRLDADGLFASDRYIAVDQIAEADADRLVLSVRKEDLIKTH